MLCIKSRIHLLSLSTLLFIHCTGDCFQSSCTSIRRDTDHVPIVIYCDPRKRLLPRLGLTAQG